MTMEREQKIWMTHWRGKEISEMSRDELIEAMQWLAGQYHRFMGVEATAERAAGRMAMARK